MIKFQIEEMSVKDMILCKKFNSYDIYSSLRGNVRDMILYNLKNNMANIQYMITYSSEICITRDHGLYPLLPFILFPYLHS